MGYIDDYKLRLESYGASIEDAQRKQTIDIINNSFQDSPFYKKLYINNALTECRIIDTDKSFVKKLLFLPGIIKNIGEMVLINDNSWLIADSQNNDMFSRALIQLCNEKLKWKDKNNITQDYSCIVTKSNLMKFDTDETKYINILEGSFFIYVTNDENTINIEPNTRIILGSQAYQIVGMNDVTNKGIIEFSVRIDTKRDSDDFINKIADNNGNGSNNNGDDGDDGGLW